MLQLAELLNSFKLDKPVNPALSFILLQTQPFVVPFRQGFVHIHTIRGTKESSL